VAAVGLKLGVLVRARRNRQLLIGRGFLVVAGGAVEGCSGGWLGRLEVTVHSMLKVVFDIGQHLTCSGA
jgi:hypothetical protein